MTPITRTVGLYLVILIALAQLSNGVRALLDPLEFSGYFGVTASADVAWVKIYALRCLLLGTLAAVLLWRREISALRWCAADALGRSLALAESRCRHMDPAAPCRHCPGTGDDLRVLASLVAAWRDELTRSFATTRTTLNVSMSRGGGGFGRRRPGQNPRAANNDHADFQPRGCATRVKRFSLPARGERTLVVPCAYRWFPHDEACARTTLPRAGTRTTRASGHLDVSRSAAACET